MLRVPQLAIHLDPRLSADGLKLDAQQHVVPIWSLGEPDPGGFARFLAAELDVPPEDVLSHDVVTYDLTGGTLAGAGEEFVSSGRQDDLTLSHASVTALCEVAARGAQVAARGEVAGGQPGSAAEHVSAVVLFDNEEIGSQSATGARGAWLGRQMERSVLARGGGRDDFLRAVASSLHVSADMTHATHPNYAERHEPGHWVGVRRRPGDQGERQRQLRHDGTDARGLPARGRAGEGARAVLRQPERCAQRVDDRPDRGRGPGHPDRWTSAARRWPCTQRGSCPGRPTRR